jgi:glycosyltransferase involved in cell wall biosynthesis
MERKLVSVIIPVYNCGLYLAEAIESVLEQTYRRWEIIVVDDGSTDNSAQVAKRFSGLAQYVYQDHLGAGAARNKGVGLAAGEFIAFLDADDIWSKDKLSLQMEAFNTDPSLDMVQGYIRQFYSPELGVKVKMDPDKEVLQGTIPSALMVRRNSFLRAGLFATGRKVGEVLDWYTKAMGAGLKSSMLPQIVAQRRIHTTNVGIRLRDFRGDYISVLKEHLDRQRKIN